MLIPIEKKRKKKSEDGYQDYGTVNQLHTTFFFPMEKAIYLFEVNVARRASGPYRERVRLHVTSSVDGRSFFPLHNPCS